LQGLFQPPSITAAEPDADERRRGPDRTGCVDAVGWHFGAKIVSLNVEAEALSAATSLRGRPHSRQSRRAIRDIRSAIGDARGAALALYSDSCV
jgi:hypothetical protein